MPALYRTYRPRTWADVVGQEHVTKALAWQVANGQPSHAYLFAGPRGVGKTTCARILARAVNCPSRAEGSGEPCGTCVNCESVLSGSALDVIEIDAASNRGIDVVRDVIIENARFAPSSLAYKVFVLDEAHMLTTEAWNALLKTLEEPSGRAIFVLATTELHKVPATVQSRCQRYDFARLAMPVLVERLNGLASKEGVVVDERVIRAIAKAADGCARDAESLLGQALTAAKDGQLSYDDAVSVLPLADADGPLRFLSAALSGDAAAALTEVTELSRRGSDLAVFHDAVAVLCRDALVWSMAGERAFSATDDATKQALSTLAKSGSGRLSPALDAILARRRLSSVSPDPSLPLALVVADIVGVSVVAPAPAVSAPVMATPPTTTKSTITIKQAATTKPESVVVTAEAVTEPEAAIPATAVVSSPEPVVAVPAMAPVAVSEPVASVAVPTPNTDTTPVIALDQLKSKWPTVINKVNELLPSLSFVLATTNPVEVVGNLVKFGVQYPFHRDKANVDKNRLAIEAAILAVFSVAVCVEAVHLENMPRAGHDQAADGSVTPVTPAPSTTVEALNAVFG